MARVLIASADKELIISLTEMLKEFGHEPAGVVSPKTFTPGAIGQKDAEVLLFDAATEEAPDAPILVLDGRAPVERDSRRRGDSDPYRLSRPVDPVELKSKLECAVHLAANDGRYRELFKQADEALLLVDENSTILDANDEARRMAGYDPGELATMKVSDLFTGDPGGKDERAARQNSISDAATYLYTELRHRNGDASPVLVNVERLKTKGKILSKYTLRELPQIDEPEAKRDRDALEHVADGIVTVNLKGVLTSCNQAFLGMAGYKKEEMIGRHLTRLPQLRLRDIPGYVKHFASIMRGAKTEPIEVFWRRRDGSQRVGEVLANPIKKNGEIIGLRAIIRDLTERKRNEEAIRTSEERFRTMFEFSPEAIVLIDRSGKIVIINKKVHDWLGYEPEEIIGKRISTLPFFTVKSLFKVLRRFKQRIQGLDVPPYELEFLDKEGRTVYGRLTANPIRDERGEIASILVMISNITEQIKAEEELRIKDSAIESSINAIAIADLNGSLTYVNNSFLKLWGYDDVEDVVGKPSETFWQAEEKAVQILEALRKEGGWFGELAAKKNDGSKINVQLSANMVTDETGKPVCMMGSFIDITERRRAEEALAESEERFRTMTASAHDAIIMINNEGTITYWNEAAERIFRYSKREALNNDVHQFLALERYHDAYLKGFSAFRETGEGPVIGRMIELEGIRKDGTELPVELSVSSVKVNGRWQAIGIVRDITERRRAEEKIKATLQEKEVLLKEIHHRVKNNLQIISSLLFLGARDIKDPQAQRIFTDSQNRIKSMAFIHEKLYQSEDLSRINFTDYVRDLLDSLLITYASVSRHVKLELDLCELRLELNTAIPLSLIINELISNALEHAFPDERRGRLTVSLKRMGEEKCALNIVDNGVGLPDGLDSLDTKSLGLQLVKMLCDQLKAKLELVNRRGAEFRIEFPVKNGGVRS